MNLRTVGDPAELLAAIVQSSNDAIVAKALDGTILSWNVGAERIFGYAPDEILGRSIRALIPQDRQDEEDRIIASVARGEVVPMFETTRLRKDGSEVFVAVTVSPVRGADGQIVAASKIARDITEMKRVRSLLDETEARLDLLANNISQLAWIADESGWLYWYNNRWYEYTGTTLEEMQGWGWSKVHHPDYLEPVTERWKRHLASGEEWEDTFPLRGADGSYRWFLSRAVPRRDAGGKVTHWFGSNTDITEMRDAEKRIELLLMEVNHRSKNMLAIVLSLARRSLRDGGDAIGRFEERIRGLAASQDLLVERAWSSVPVRAVIQTQLRFLLDSQRAQVVLRGPDTSLAPGASEAIGMAVHEMATNAIKHGALSAPEGKVEVTWGLEGSGDAAEFWMEWNESSGPVVREPSRRGFGTRIIADVPESKLSGRAETTFDPQGFRWRFRCPAGMALGAAD